MRAFWAAAVVAAIGATAGAVTPLAAQLGTGMSKATTAGPQLATGQARGRRAETMSPMASGKRQWGPLFTFQKMALDASGQLKDYDSAGTHKVQLDALGKALTGEENQFGALARTATGADRQTLAQAQAHERQARTHYQALLRPGADAQTLGRHARVLREELLLVDRALHRSGGDPSTSRIIHRAFGGHQPKDTSGNVIRQGEGNCLRAGARAGANGNCLTAGRGQGNG